MSTEKYYSVVDHCLSLNYFRESIIGEHQHVHLFL